MTHECWWEIEEWIPAENAIGGKGYWTGLCDDINAWTHRFHDEPYVRQTFKKLVTDGRKVRLCSITKIIEGAEEVKL